MSVSSGDIFIFIGTCIFVGWFGHEYGDFLIVKEFVSAFISAGISGFIIFIMFFNVFKMNELEKEIDIQKDT